MEIDPRHQKTRPDFVVTEQLWGVRAVDVRVGRQARTGGSSTIATASDTRIARIYNRVIPDELQHKQVTLPFDYRDDARRRVERRARLVFPHQQVLDSVAAPPVGAARRSISAT